MALSKKSIQLRKENRKKDTNPLRLRGSAFFHSAIIQSAVRIYAFCLMKSLKGNRKGAKQITDFMDCTEAPNSNHGFHGLHIRPNS
jgi:hypothetical protein